MLLDASSGNVSQKYVYDAFGNIISQEGDADNQILYAGYQYDPETELYYVNARYYDSSSARFLTEDTYSGRTSWCSVLLVITLSRQTRTSCLFSIAISRRRLLSR